MSENPEGRTGHLDDRVVEFALGTLEGAEQAELSRHVASCSRCRLDVAMATESLTAMALSLPEVEPSPIVRQRLLDVTRPVEPVRGISYAGKVAEFFGLAPHEGRWLLEKASAEVAWSPGPVPGVDVLRVLAAPQWRAAETILVRIAGGLSLPPHSHLGDEHMLMIDGSIEYDDGSSLLPGQRATHSTADEHGFVVPAEGCVCAMILFGGMEIRGFGRVTFLP